MQLDCSIIAIEFCKAIKEKSYISVLHLQTNIKKKKKNFGYYVLYHRVSEGKRKALTKVFGDYNESYKLSPNGCIWLYIPIPTCM